MTKIAMIQPKGKPTMTVYYDEKAENNPYRVYLEWKELIAYGLRQRRKLVDRYADLYSCAAMMAQYAYENNEEGR